MKHDSCTVLVLGGGPGGYVCALRAAQFGLDTVLVEAAALGGTCLNVGCIPSKALIHAAAEMDVARANAADNPLGISASAPSIDLARTQVWKSGIVARLTGGVGALLKRAKVRVVQGRATVLDGKTVDVATPEGPIRLRTANLVIATGSVSQELPNLPVGGAILSSSEALALDQVPATMAVVGGGYIGLEIGTAMASFGARVTVVEVAARILPQYDAELTRPVVSRLGHLGVKVLTDTRAEGYADGRLRVVSAESSQEIEADKVLVAVGRRPNTRGFGLEDLALDMQGDVIAVDERCRTAMEGVFAIGDVTGDPMLAHRAMAQGRIAAEVIAGQPSVWDHRAVPAVCFTDPEVVSVGHLPGDVPEAAVARFPLAANGRALSLGREDGFIRILHDRQSGVIHGIQATGPGVAELSGEFALAIEMGSTLTDLTATIHAHPTLGEALPEAALVGAGMGLHI